MKKTIFFEQKKPENDLNLIGHNISGCTHHPANGSRSLGQPGVRPFSAGDLSFGEISNFTHQWPAGLRWRAEFSLVFDVAIAPRAPAEGRYRSRRVGERACAGMLDLAITLAWGTHALYSRFAPACEPSARKRSFSPGQCPATLWQLFFCVRRRGKHPKAM